MSGEANGANGNVNQEPDFAQASLESLHVELLTLTDVQAFKDLQRGERAAAALEGHLDLLEKKIEELLAKADEDERRMQASSKPSPDKLSSEDKGKDGSVA
ncbi:hypothetical protein BDV96DRAFT_692163 [Lophiotrema nucula]|uniref:Uncharacterized protein n=1 Tax=Lophiotrema nucula TaxID=690887 RepID=A0A6A5YS44_9PLEO|nr:hypothetical protein BDV96DRAFT_692163 [Lophiotrema nucula]